MNFLAQNTATVIICAVLLAVVVLIVFSLRRKARKGQCIGCDGCNKKSGCPHSSCSSSNSEIKG